LGQGIIPFVVRWDFTAFTTEKSQGRLARIPDSIDETGIVKRMREEYLPSVEKAMTDAFKKTRARGAKGREGEVGNYFTSFSGAFSAGLPAGFPVGFRLIV
jgi:hypothetical protein